jgi:phosphatidylglycerol:prolipoprotein diacylglycerol transferase
VEPVPTSFHIGPLVFHTYGLGLAVAAYVAFRYAELRFRRRGLSTEKFARFTMVMLALGVVGARIAHVATNWGHYGSDPLAMFAVWQGGLSSFGGIALAAPVGYVLARRWWPDCRLLEFTDALLPAMVAGWALGRVLGPQFEIAGGGHLTHQWFGMDYAGQVGPRVPVPLIQSAEDGLLWLGLIWLEHRRNGRARLGLATGVALVVWGLVRATDEKLLLGQDSHSGSVGVQIAGVVLAIIGAAVLGYVAKRPATTRESSPSVSE